MGHETPRLRNRGRHYALLAVKRVARISLGLVWLYQGLIPKIFTLVPLACIIHKEKGGLL